MSKLLRKKQFEDVIKALWDKAKEKFIEDITFDTTTDPQTNKPKNTLKKTKNGQPTDVVNHVVTEWQDLDYVEQYQYVNLMEYNKKVTGYHYGGNNDAWVENPDWSTYFLDVKPGEDYTFLRRNNDNGRYIFTDSVGGNKLNAITPGTFTHNGFTGCHFTVPSNPQSITKVAIQFQHDTNTINDMMIFRGSTQTFDKFTPFADGKVIQVLDDISFEFDNSNSSLSSTTISSAIKELDGKIAGSAVTYDEPTRTLKQTINGVEQEIVTGLVTKWEDLDDVYKLTNINLYNPLTVVYGERYNGGNGQVEKANDWARVSLDVTDGTYTVIKNTHDSQTYVFLDAQDNVLQVAPNSGSSENGRKKYSITVPQQAGTPLTNVAKLGFNIHPNNKGNIEDIMVFKGNVPVPSQTIPFTNGADVIVDGSQVSVAFDNRNTNLLSQTVAGAIDEINNKYEGAIKKWEDLDYVDKLNRQNLYNPFGNVIYGSKYTTYGNNIAIAQDSNWARAKVPIERDKVYTLYQTNHCSIQMVYLNENGDAISIASPTRRNDAGALFKVRYTIDTSNITADAKYLGFSLYVEDGHPDYTSPTTGVMFFEGNFLEVFDRFIPYTNGATIVIDNKNVATGFDNVGTSIQSTTVENAIKELDVKIVNTGTVKSVNQQPPQADGNVTVNAGHIGYDNVQSLIQANTVQQAIDMLKQDVDLLPTASIYIVPNKQELDILLNQNVLNHGDLVYVIDSNGVIDFNNQPVDGGNPVAMIYDTSLSDTTNRLRVFSKFSSNVNVSANNVSYNDATTQLNAQNVQGAIEKLNDKITNVGGGAVTSVNGERPQNGEVVLISQVTQDVGQNIVFKVGNQNNFATLECMTDQDVTTIINGFTL